MKADTDKIAAVFNQDALDALFPADRADQFFDALLGDASEGAYDIRLRFNALESSRLVFDLELHQRPGKCLVCNLTYGLPNVFSRHPIINIQGVVDEIDKLMDGHGTITGWKLGKTIEMSRELHVVPLVIDIQ